jgi:N-acetylglutamate synthase-like GNAT family acetyltransferase
MLSSVTLLRCSVATLLAILSSILRDPENSILSKGGQIYMVYANTKPVGCVALMHLGNGVCELSKMAISPHLRGQGQGRRLLHHTISQAQLIGAKSLFLGGSPKLPNAVHLYESVGFRHVSAETLPPMPYTRANVFMEMTLYAHTGDHP